MPLVQLFFFGWNFFLFAKICWRLEPQAIAAKLRAPQNCSQLTNLTLATTKKKCQKVNQNKFKLEKVHRFVSGRRRFFNESDFLCSHSSEWQLSDCCGCLCTCILACDFFWPKYVNEAQQKNKNFQEKKRLAFFVLFAENFQDVWLKLISTTTKKNQKQ